jgi:hypothetical protein
VTCGPDIVDKRQHSWFVAVLRVPEHPTCVLGAIDATDTVQVVVFENSLVLAVERDLAGIQQLTVGLSAG